MDAPEPSATPLLIEDSLKFDVQLVLDKDFNSSFVYDLKLWLYLNIAYNFQLGNLGSYTISSTGSLIPSLLLPQST